MENVGEILRNQCLLGIPLGLYGNGVNWVPWVGLLRRCVLGVANWVPDGAVVKFLASRASWHLGFVRNSELAGGGTPVALLHDEWKNCGVGKIRISL